MVYAVRKNRANKNTQDPKIEKEYAPTKPAKPVTVQAPPQKEVDEDFMVFVDHNVYLKVSEGNKVNWVYDLKHATRFKGSDILLSPLPFYVAREVRKAKCFRIKGDKLGSEVAISLPENSVDNTRNRKHKGK